MGSSRVSVQGSKDCVWGWGYLSCVGVLVRGRLGLGGLRVKGSKKFGCGV